MPNHQHLVDSKRKIIFLILILGSITAIGPLTIDMYLPAFSAIAESFKASDNVMQLSLTFYFVGIALSQLLYGPIIDRFGKRLPLLCGLSIFVFASILCCFVTDIKQLIVLRFFQAMGACVGVIVPRAIVRDIFSPQESARIFSHLMLVMGVAPILAPLMGSLVLGYFGWKAIFVFLAICGFLCFVISYFALPQTTKADKEVRMSQAFKKYFAILQDKNFVICAISGSFIMSGLFAYITASPFAFLEFFSLTPKDYSIIFTVNSIGFIAMSQINAFLLKKFSIKQVLEKTLLVPVISGITLIFIAMNQPYFLPFVIIIFMFIASISTISPNTTALALSNQKKHSGSASSLLGTIQFSFATVASFLISKFHDESLVPMTIVIGFCGIGSCLVYKVFK